jgi:tetratricopeptide (TPR) repeat protein
MKPVISFLLFIALTSGQAFAQQSELLAHAFELYENGKYAEAITTVDRIIASDENTFDAWLIKGNSFQKEEKFVAAVQAYETAQSINAESAPLNTFHGAAFINLQQYTEAEKKLKKALKLDPEFAEAHYFMGNVQYFNYSTNAAIRSYNEAIRLKPQYRDALYMRAASLAELGKYEEALRDYQAALDIDPTLTTAAYNIAIIYLQAEQYEKAGNLLAEIDPAALPDQRDYHFYLGEALYFSDKKEDACAAYLIAKDHGDTEAADIYQRYCISKEERKAPAEKRTIRMAF